MVSSRIYRTLFIAGTALGLLASVTGCKKQTTTTTTVAATELGPESYVIVGNGIVESGPSISGTLVPRLQAVVKSQAAGTVLKTFVEQGQPVRAGEVLAEIDATSLSDAVASAKYGAANAQSALDVAQREESRQSTLLKAGAISQQSVDLAKKSTVAAEAGLAQARATLAGAQKQLANATATAPFSGIVSEKSVSTGDVVQQGSPLYTVVDPSTLELQGTIPADALSSVHIGLPIKFTVTGYPNQLFTGSITRINPTADPSTRQVRIYAEIPNLGHNLVGGLFAQGRIGSVLKTAITVPSDAIDHKMITPAVERLHNGIVERTVVTLGTVDEQNGVVQILSGINPGDTVLRGPAMDLTLGTHIKPISSPLGTDSAAALDRTSSSSSSTPSSAPHSSSGPSSPTTH